jgi:hypothetical protein
LGMALHFGFRYYWPKPATVVPQQGWVVRDWHFLPLAFLNAIASTLIGSTGPMLNPLYLNYGLTKEDLIATKAIHNIALHLIKLLAYLSLGSLTMQEVGYGCLIGVAGIPANWLGKQVLVRVSLCAGGGEWGGDGVANYAGINLGLESIGSVPDLLMDSQMGHGMGALGDLCRGRFIPDFFATEPVCSIKTCPARAIGGEDIWRWVQEKYPWLRRSPGRVLAVGSGKPALAEAISGACFGGRFIPVAIQLIE